MRKLLQINVVSNILSTGYIVEDISKVAQRSGWDTYVCYGRKSIPGVNKEYRIGTIIESFWHYIENRLFDNEGLSSRFATYRLVRYIKKIKPDIVHLHNIHDHYLNYRILFNYLNKTSITVIWTFHDFWAITGHCHHYIDVQCDLWKSECNHCPLQHSTVNSFVDRSKRNYNLKRQLFCSNNNLSIVAVSRWVEKSVRESFLKEKNILTIPNGINFEELVAEPVADNPLIPRNRFVILGVAREWARGDRKGFDDYIKLSQLLRKDEIIVLVGIRKEQQKILPANVIGIEKTFSRNEIANIYRCADVLLSLSAAETFGLTIIEANAFGVPAVVYDNTAPPSLITSGTGFIAKNGDIYDVYSKIEIIKSKGKDYYSNLCKEYAKNNYDKNICYCKYIEMYEDLISKNE